MKKKYWILGIFAVLGLLFIFPGHKLATGTCQFENRCD